jgi:hypothetical protein
MANDSDFLADWTSDPALTAVEHAREAGAAALLADFRAEEATLDEAQLRALYAARRAHLNRVWTAKYAASARAQAVRA